MGTMESILQLANSQDRENIDTEKRTHQERDVFLGLGWRRNVAAEMGLTLDVLSSLQPTLKSLVVVADHFSHSWSSLP